MGMKGRVLVEDGFRFQEETHLTVCKTSPFFADDGFNVYDAAGDLVTPTALTPVIRAKLSSWMLTAAASSLSNAGGRAFINGEKGFSGERLGQKPMFSVRRSSIIGRSRVMVEVFGDPEEPDSRESCFHIEESFTQRCCMVLDSWREVVAELRRKVDPATNVILGKDVFLLCLRLGFDCAFAMGLVLVLDHINVVADDDKFDNGRDERDGADVAEDI